MKIKAIALKYPGGFDNMIVSERKLLPIKDDEVVVRWHATSLNFHDYLVAKGLIPVENNRIIMSDGAGEILEVGAAVNHFQVGDRVMSLFFPNWLSGRPNFQNTRAILGESVDGCMTNISKVSGISLTKIPKEYTFREAATLPCAGLTAWRALVVESKIKPGDIVLLEGSGGVSLAALQIAKSAGAYCIVTSSSDQKLEKLSALGADETINYSKDINWGKSIYNKFGGADIVLDMGGGSTIKQSIEACAVGATIVAIGILKGGRKGEITFPKLFFKHINLVGIAVGSASMQNDMVKAINLKTWKPVISHSYNFETLKDAFLLMEEQKHFGKIVVDI